VGFGKILKDISKGVKDLNEDRKERNERDRLREFQRKEDISTGRFCKICKRTGEFGNQCEDCQTYPICDNCCTTNKIHGTICAHCFSDHACFAEGCRSLSAEECVACNRAVCQSDHWYAFFVEKGKIFSCIYDKGNVCKYCAEDGKRGTFTKHYDCPRCGNELRQQTFD